MNLILAIASTLTLFFHADGLAEFEYSLDQQHIVLKVEMDQRELENYQPNMGCSKEIFLGLCTSNYIQAHTNLKINGTPVLFEFENTSKYNGHVILSLKSIKSYSEITDIEVTNNCFYELNAAFKNRIRIDLENIQKSYLLTKGKEKVKLRSTIL